MREVVGTEELLEDGFLEEHVSLFIGVHQIDQKADHLGDFSMLDHQVKQKGQDHVRMSS